MKTATIEKKFSGIGARIKIADRPVNGDISIDIRRDKEGEFFDIVSNSEVIDLQVLDVQKKDRHILLMAKEDGGDKKKFLCGYDERHFFSCAIPETAGVSTVFGAKQALKPIDVLQAESGKVKTKNLHKRRKRTKDGKMYRQGEFFFTPIPYPFISKDTVIHKKEPMQRGGGNPHVAEFLIRSGGTNVWVCSRHRDGIGEKEYKKILKGNKDAKKWGWTTMRLNANVMVKGKITHTDHKTLNLGETWYRVFLNTEDKARGAINVRFLD
jgi:hypothetical protein